MRAEVSEEKMRAATSHVEEKYARRRRWVGRDHILVVSEDAAYSVFLKCC